MRHRTFVWLCMLALPLVLDLASGRARAQRRPGVLVEVSMRGGADVRPAGSWTVQLVIRDDGSWTSDGRAGQLTAAQTALIRRLATRAQLTVIRPTGPVCAALPTAAYRVRTWRGSVIWASPCAPSAHRSVSALLAQARALTSPAVAPPPSPPTDAPS